MQVCNLKAYLANIGMTLKDFCQILEYNEKYMSKVMNGRKEAGHRLAKEISKATNGLISLKTRVRRRDLKKRQEEQKKSSSE